MFSYKLATGLAFLGVVCLSISCTQSPTPEDQSQSSVQAQAKTERATQPHSHDHGVPMVSADFAKVYYDNGQAKFLDVRGDHAFGAERIAGATSVSLLDMRQGILPDWPRDQLIVAYCGCPHAMSVEAASILIRRGFTNVFVMDEGYYYWKEKGYPIEASNDPENALRRMTIRGTAPGLAAGTPVYAAHDKTGQLEAAAIKADGSFELHLPFYGVADREPIRVYAEGREATVGFSEAGGGVLLAQ